MITLIKIGICFFGALAVVYGCSEPLGGYKEPTPAENVHYAKHVIVGEVTDILRPDPVFGDMYGDSTYGAMVDVHCSYKGGPLPARIQVGGAGFIPGHCTSMDLEKGKQYVIFLHDKRENEDLYEQSQYAELKDILMDYLRVCNLHMEYPAEKGMVLKRATCPPATKLETCQRYVDGETNTPVTVDKGTVKGPPKDMQDQNTGPEENPSIGKSASDDGNAASTVMSSFLTILIALAIRSI